MSKKSIALLIALLMTLSLAACGGSGSSDANDDSQEAAAATEESADAESSADTEENADNAADANETANAGDVLIIYFSAANMNSADATTGATPMVDGDGTTGWIANVIHDAVGGEVVKITPKTDYPTDYKESTEFADKEKADNARPEFNDLGVDPSTYKTVFIGYPIWWYQMPMVMETFFDKYDFNGTTIIPFNTHEGSGDSGTYEDIKEREPNATVLDGLAMRGGKAGTDDAKIEISDWLSGLNL